MGIYNAAELPSRESVCSESASIFLAHFNNNSEENDDVGNHPTPSRV
jgi:hypothetical protein